MGSETLFSVCSWEGGIVASETGRTSGRGIGANFGVEDSRKGTWRQLVEGTVWVQVAENFGSPTPSKALNSLGDLATCHGTARVRGEGLRWPSAGLRRELVVSFQGFVAAGL